MPNAGKQENSAINNGNCRGQVLMEEIEKAFEQTAEILFGKKLGSMSTYETWLERHVKGKIEGKKSKISANTVYVPSVDFYRQLGTNIVTLDESLKLGEIGRAHV